MRFFPQIRINLPAGNHPCQIFPANQDHFPRRKSSLPDISCESGSIFPLEIIPARHFPRIRMNSRVGNHPCEIFSHKSGSISLLEIIPARYFPQIRIIFPDENHPCKSFSSNQDQSPRRKSSLPDISCKSGSFSSTRIIPAKAFHQIRINLPAENASPAALSGKSR